MSLDGAQLNFVNAEGISTSFTAKGRKFNVGSSLGSDLVLPEAERLHCEIQCDAFGRVTICNHSAAEPISLNDQLLDASSKRPLLHGARIKILNDVYTWHFPKIEDASTPSRPPPEQAPKSSPCLKGNRQRQQIDNRLTVHNFRYSINSDDEGNTSIESRQLEVSTCCNAGEATDVADSSRCKTPVAPEADDTEPKVNLLEATQNKENTSSPCNKLLLELCARSDMVITSFSPRQTGVKIEKSFTCVMKPSTGLGLLSAGTTPKSVYNTPKSILSEQNDDSCSRDLMDFCTPSTSKKCLPGKTQTSMYLIDLTTPQRLRPTLSGTPKQTPSSAGVISVHSTDDSSAESPMVIDITNSSTPSSSTPAKNEATSRLMPKTPKEQTLAGCSTPKRTPQSLMKRALLTSAKKQLPASSTSKQTTPARRSLLEGRRQCLTAPRRLPFHPQPQWRTPPRRQLADFSKEGPLTSPRARSSSGCPSSPRDTKISKLRKSLAAAAKASPSVGMSNKLVAKARRALNSPNQNSPQRIASPIMEELLNESEPGNNPSAELSRTFTIETEDEASTVDLETKCDEEKGFLDNLLNKNEKPPSSGQDELNPPNGSSNKVTSESEPKDDDPNTVQEDTEHQRLDRTFDTSASQGQNESQKASPQETKTKEALVSNKSLVEQAIVDNGELYETFPDKAMESNEPNTDENIPEKEVELKVTSDNTEKPDPNSEKIEEPEPEKIAPLRQPEVIEETEPQAVSSEVTESSETVHIIEENICEEVDTVQEEPIVAEVHLGEHAVYEEVSAQTIPVATPKRAKRRSSVEPVAVTNTPRRSVRRASIEASHKLEEQHTKPVRRASCTATLENQESTLAPITPKRKRRLTEELSTPTRKSLRLQTTTPKRTAPVDESVGDMGVIVEENDLEEPNADKIPADEDYGNELAVDENDEPDRINYQGMREMLKTPKNCSTPRFKGLRELMRTPKAPSSPMLDHIDELLEADSSDTTGSPRRQITINRVNLELTQTETQDLYFKTPRGKDLMIPNDPASAVLKTRENTLATTTEYDLNATDTTLHLDKIFDDVLPTETANTVESSELEINVTAVSAANSTTADPLSTSGSTSVAPSLGPSDTVNSEALMTIGDIDVSHRDPLTSTAVKPANTAGQDDHKSMANKYPNICEVSGIQLLDQTSDSMFSEQLLVTGVDSRDVTFEETNATSMANARTPRKSPRDDASDTDSMLGLAEPLVVSDDEAEKSAPESTSKSLLSNANQISVVEGANAPQEEQEQIQEKSMNAPELGKINESINEQELEGAKDSLGTEEDNTTEESDSVQEHDITEKSLVTETASPKDNLSHLDGSQIDQEDEASSVEEISILEVSNQSDSQIELETTNLDARIDMSIYSRKSTIYGLDINKEDSFANEGGEVEGDSTVEVQISQTSLCEDVTNVSNQSEDISIIELEASSNTTVDKSNLAAGDEEHNQEEHLEEPTTEVQDVDSSVKEVKINTDDIKVLNSEISGGDRVEIMPKQHLETTSNDNSVNDENEPQLQADKDSGKDQKPESEEATYEENPLKNTSLEGNDLSEVQIVNLEDSLIEEDTSVLAEPDMADEKLEASQTTHEAQDETQVKLEEASISDSLVEVDTSVVAEIYVSDDVIEELDLDNQTTTSDSASQHSLKEPYPNEVPASDNEAKQEQTSLLEEEISQSEMSPVESSSQVSVEANESINDNPKVFNDSIDVLPRSSEESTADTNEKRSPVQEISSLELNASLADDSVNEETNENAINDTLPSKISESLIKSDVSVVGAQVDNILEEPNKDVAPIDESIIQNEQHSSENRELNVPEVKTMDESSAVEAVEAECTEDDNKDPAEQLMSGIENSLVEEYIQIAAETLPSEDMDKNISDVPNEGVSSVAEVNDEGVTSAEVIPEELSMEKNDNICEKTTGKEEVQLPTKEEDTKVNDEVIEDEGVEILQPTKVANNPPESMDSQPEPAQPDDVGENATTIDDEEEIESRVEKLIDSNESFEEANSTFENVGLMATPVEEEQKTSPSPHADSTIQDEDAANFHMFEPASETLETEQKLISDEELGTHNEEAIASQFNTELPENPNEEDSAANAVQKPCYQGEEVQADKTKEDLEGETENPGEISQPLDTEDPLNNKGDADDKISSTEDSEDKTSSESTDNTSSEPDDKTSSESGDKTSSETGEDTTSSSSQDGSGKTIMSTHPIDTGEIIEIEDTSNSMTEPSSSDPPSYEDTPLIELDDSTIDSHAMSEPIFRVPFETDVVIELNDSTTESGSALDKQSDAAGDLPLDEPVEQSPAEPSEENGSPPELDYQEPIEQPTAEPREENCSSINVQSKDDLTTVHQEPAEQSSTAKNDSSSNYQEGVEQPFAEPSEGKSPYTNVESENVSPTDYQEEVEQTSTETSEETSSTTNIETEDSSPREPFDQETVHGSEAASVSSQNELGSSEAQQEESSGNTDNIEDDESAKTSPERECREEEENVVSENVSTPPVISLDETNDKKGDKEILNSSEQHAENESKKTFDGLKSIHTENDKMESEETKPVEPIKRRVRGRKPSAETEPAPEREMKTVKQKDTETSSTRSKSNRRGRKATTDTDETETKTEEKIEDAIEEESETHKSGQSAHSTRGKRGARKLADTDGNIAEIEKEEKKTTSEENAEIISQDIGEPQKPKRRARKPVEKTVELVEMQEEEPNANVNEEESVKEPPRKRGRKSIDTEESKSKAEESAESTKPEDTVKHVEEQLEEPKKKRQPKKKLEEKTEEPLVEKREHPAECENIEETSSPPKAKRRARKPAADKTTDKKAQEEHVEEANETTKTKTKRGQKATTVEVELKETTDEKMLEEQSELDKPVKQGRKSITDVDKTEEDTTDEAVKEKPKRRGRKASADEAAVPTEIHESPAKEPVKEKPKRRGRKASVDEATGPPERKPIRVTRKASAETMEHMEKIPERLAPTMEESEPLSKILRIEEPTTSVVTPTLKRRGRQPSVVKEAQAQSLPVASGSRRGRKATTDAELPPEPAEVKRLARKRSADEPHPENIEETPKPTKRGRKPSADVDHPAVPDVAEKAVEKKVNRRNRKPAAHLEATEEEPPAAKKPNARRVRKVSVVEELELPTELSVATVVAAASPKPHPISSEDELTPRRREGRNMPRKNYDETSDEEKRGPTTSPRRGRKPAASKAAKTVGASTPPMPKPTTPLLAKVNPAAVGSTEDLAAPHTPAGTTVVLPEPTSSQRREGRNVPRKNYSETSDDDKPATSRGRRVRQPTAKALELLVDMEAVKRPATPKRRKAKGEAEQSAEKLVESDKPTPVAAKSRGRPKVVPVDNVPEIVSAEPPVTKRTAHSQKESTSSQHEESEQEPEPKLKAAKRNVRGASNSRKAKVPVEEEVTGEKPVAKKARGGARAMTPNIVEHADMASVEVPVAKKTPAARGRPRSSKSAEKVEAPPELAAATRAGRGRKVHFETLDEPPSAAAEPLPAKTEAPKRATRSRRK